MIARTQARLAMSERARADESARATVQTMALAVHMPRVLIERARRQQSVRSRTPRHKVCACDARRVNDSDLGASREYC
jgi:hypothetical protein